MDDFENLNEIEDRYEIIEQVGDGSQGDLFAGRDRRSSRKVAIKIQKERGFESDRYYRLLAEELDSEGDYTHRLAHIPGIPELLDKGRYEERHCIVLEFVEGTLLSNALASARPLRVPTVASIIGQLCEILDGVHRGRFVHRDVKPENIMVEPTGRIRLLDLGLAVEANTETCFGSGTIGYAPPEQLDANPAGVTGQADIFALGCMMLEMTVIQLPYSGKRPTLGVPVLPPDRLAAIPAELHALVLQMVEYEAEHRPANVRDVFACLRPYLPEIGSRPPAKPLRPDPTEYYRRHTPTL